MERISVITGKLLDQWRSLDRRDNMFTYKVLLKKVLTKHEQRHIKSYSLKENNIIIRVDSSAWLYTLNLKKRDILATLNNMLPPESRINRLNLKLDNQKDK